MIAKSSIQKVDTDLTTMINGMLYVQILCISLELVVIIVQHAVLLWCVSFCLTGGTVMIHNGLFGDENLVNRRKIGERLGCRVVTYNS